MDESIWRARRGTDNIILLLSTTNLLYNADTWLYEVVNIREREKERTKLRGQEQSWEGRYNRIFQD